MLRINWAPRRKQKVKGSKAPLLCACVDLCGDVVVRHISKLVYHQHGPWQLVLCQSVSNRSVMTTCSDVLCHRVLTETRSFFDTDLALAVIISFHTIQRWSGLVVIHIRGSTTPTCSNVCDHNSCRNGVYIIARWLTCSFVHILCEALLSLASIDEVTSTHLDKSRQTLLTQVNGARLAIY